MKFTSLAVAALFVANTSAVILSDKKKGDNGNGLAYDLDVPTLKKAEGDNAAKTQAFNGAKESLETAQEKADLAKTQSADAKAADATATGEKQAARKVLESAGHLDADYDSVESTHKAAVKAKWDTLDAKLRTEDDLIEKNHVLERKKRDFDAATAAKEASDANLKANQDRVANEKDQLERGENQDRLKTVTHNSQAKVSEIQGKHDERERGNGRLFKAVASI